MSFWSAYLDELLKLGQPMLQQQHQFAGQMNQFLKSLQQYKWGPANVFGERSKRPKVQIYFPQAGQKVGASPSGFMIRPMHEGEDKKWGLRPDADMRKKHYEFRIALDPKGELAGFAVSNPGTKTLRSLWVQPEFRRRGVATALISSFKTEPVRLSVRRENEQAKNLYSGLGFAKKRQNPTSEIWTKSASLFRYLAERES